MVNRAVTFAHRRNRCQKEPRVYGRIPEQKTRASAPSHAVITTSAETAENFGNKR